MKSRAELAAETLRVGFPKMAAEIAFDPRRCPMEPIVSKEEVLALAERHRIDVNGPLPSRAGVADEPEVKAKRDERLCAEDFRRGVALCRGYLPLFHLDRESPAVLVPKLGVMLGRRLTTGMVLVAVLLEGRTPTWETADG